MCFLIKKKNNDKIKERMKKKYFTQLCENQLKKQNEKVEIS